jgi:hypothetical protein
VIKGQDNLVGKPEGKTPPERYDRKYEYNIETVVKE